MRHIPSVIVIAIVVIAIPVVIIPLIHIVIACIVEVEDKTVKFHV